MTDSAFSESPEGAASEKSSNIYILIFPTGNLIKVGKADNIFNRGQSLKRHWGEIDYDNSYKIAVPGNVVYKIEKTLHFLLGEYRVESELKDGYTEVFSMEALDPALQHIEYLIGFKLISSKITQGIPKPEVLTIKRKSQSAYGRLHKKSQTMLKDVVTAAGKADRIYRWLIILLKKQHKILYQYDIIDNVVCFRIMDNNASRQYDSHKIIELFRFSYEDFRGMGGINCCSGVVVSEGIIQFDINLATPEQHDHQLLAYFHSQITYLLNKLPARSPALQQNIPVLDSHKIAKELYSSIDWNAI